jgi:hypothetical protein
VKYFASPHQRRVIVPIRTAVRLALGGLLGGYDFMELIRTWSHLTFWRFGLQSPTDLGLRWQG